MWTYPAAALQLPFSDPGAVQLGDVDADPGHPTTPEVPGTVIVAAYGPGYVTFQFSPSQPFPVGNNTVAASYTSVVGLPAWFHSCDIHLHCDTGKMLLLMSSCPCRENVESECGGSPLQATTTPAPDPASSAASNQRPTLYCELSHASPWRISCGHILTPRPMHA